MQVVNCLQTVDKNHLFFFKIVLVDWKMQLYICTRKMKQ